MKENILYLREMGCNDEKIPGDVKNHRVRVLENIDIIYKGEKYNMFFEFRQGDRYRTRYHNKRTGAELKHPIREKVNNNALWLDTQFEREEVDEIRGYTWQSSWRKSDLEEENYEKNRSFTRADILEAVNAYSIKKYNRVVLIEEEARRIAEKIGGYREKEILKNQPFFELIQWDDGHKVLKATERFYSPYRTGNSFEVDIETGKITG